MNRKQIYAYLKMTGPGDLKTEMLIDECIKEVKEFSHFKEVYLRCHLSFNPLTITELHLPLNSQDCDLYFENCQECFIIGCTLGSEIDRKIKYYQHIDLHKAYLFDGVASCYLEACANEFEKNLNLGMHTYRLCPGYGDLPLNLNEPLFKALKMDTLLLVNHYHGIMQPSKSMIGIIGIGTNKEKQCHHCIRINCCELKKEGLRCYVND